MAIFLILIGGFACSATGEVSRSGVPTRLPSERWTLDFKLSLIENKGNWVFTVDGFTDLPAATVLRARVYILDLVNVPTQGLREDDEEALLREGDGLQPAFARFTAGAGWFHQDVHVFARKPYSIRYRAKIHYFPEDQTDAIQLRVGDEPFLRRADLRLGSEESYGRELKERLAEVTQQLAALERLGLELQGMVIARPWNAPGWNGWKGPAGTTVDAIRDENRRRYAIWGVYLEGQSRMRVGALCDFLQHLIVAVDADTADRDEDRIRTLVSGYLESVEEAIDVLDADVPLNPLNLTPLLAAYDRSVASLRTSAATFDVLRKAHTGALTALFDLTCFLRVRRRGYASLNAMAASLARLYELIDAKAPAEKVQGALLEHDQAEQEFRSFARLP